MQFSSSCELAFHKLFLSLKLLQRNGLGIQSSKMTKCNYAKAFETTAFENSSGEQIKHMLMYVTPGVCDFL